MKKMCALFILATSSVNAMEDQAVICGKLLVVEDYTAEAKKTVLNELFSQMGFWEVWNHLRLQADPERHISWLNQKIVEGHDFFMWELSRAYAHVNDVENSYYWYELARLRTKQDLACYMGDLPNKLIESWNVVYYMHWSSLKKDWWHGPNYSEDNMKERIAFQKTVGLKVLETLKKWRYTASPAWISDVQAQLNQLAKKQFEFDLKQNETVAQLRPENEWTRERERVIEEYSEKLKKLDDEKFPRPSFEEWKALFSMPQKNQS